MTDTAIFHCRIHWAAESSFGRAENDWLPERRSTYCGTAGQQVNP